MEAKTQFNAQEEEDAAKLQLGPDFNSSLCLLLSEVNLLLEQNRTIHESEGHTQDLETNTVFTKSQNYVNRFSRYKGKAAVQEVRSLLAKKNLEEWELASLANLCPETSEEAKALIPSLAIKFTDDELESILSDLKNYSSF